MHDARIVHGDLRSDSILITAENRARLSEFGLSYSAYASTRTMGSRRGLIALAWAAPELFDDLERPTFACDVYSFACTCVEVCFVVARSHCDWLNLSQIYSGERPFAGLTDVQIMRVLMRGVRPSKPVNGERSRAMPEWLWQLVTRCWNEDPSARPTMDEVAQEMDRAGRKGF